RSSTHSRGRYRRRARLSATSQTTDRARGGSNRAERRRPRARREDLHAARPTPALAVELAAAREVSEGDGRARAGGRGTPGEAVGGFGFVRRADGRGLVAQLRGDGAARARRTGREFDLSSAAATAADDDAVAGHLRPRPIVGGQRSCTPGTLAARRRQTRRQ